jgi:hypothetical protein
MGTKRVVLARSRSVWSAPLCGAIRFLSNNREQQQRKSAAERRTPNASRSSVAATLCLRASAVKLAFLYFPLAFSLGFDVGSWMFVFFFPICVYLRSCAVLTNCFANRIAASMLEGFALPWPAMS